MIGRAIWYFDENRRVYRRDENGRPIGGPIWREHWIKKEVVGETSRSWLVGHAGGKPDDWDVVKIPKKPPLPRGWAWDEEEIDQQAWVMENRYRISEAVRSLGYADLRRVAEIIGWGPEEEKT